MAYDHEEQEQLDSLKAFWNQYGNLLTGPACNTTGLQARAGHRYSLEGLQWKAAGPTNLVVQPNGNGRLDGLIPLGQSQAGDAGYAGPGRVSLEGVRYYVGL